MKITIDDLSSQEIADFLKEHLQDMKSVSPPESKHALDLAGLRNANVTFWIIRDENTLVGCGALKELSAQHGEIKSMRTSSSYRGKGVATKLLTHLLDEAKSRNYCQLSLETGSMPFFKPARTLYEKFGFKRCDPFDSYKKDPNSVFMKIELATL